MKKSDLDQLRDYVSQKMEKAVVFTTEEMQTSDPTSLSSHIIHDAYKQSDSKHFADLEIAVEVNARKPVMDVKVGKRPNGVGRGIIEDFNAIFTAMFKHFEDHERIVTVWNNNHDEDPLGRFGSLSVAGVRRWLEFNQLVTVTKDKEEYQETRKDCFGTFEEPTYNYESCKKHYYCCDVELCKQKTADPDNYVEPIKKRTITIIKPTKRGKIAYENGLVIEVDWYETKVQIGLGMPYPNREASEVYSDVRNYWCSQKIAQSRQDKWMQDLRALWITLLDQNTSDALNALNSWASEKAFEWNQRKARRRNPLLIAASEPSQNKLLVWTKNVP